MVSIPGIGEVHPMMDYFMCDAHIRESNFFMAYNFCLSTNCFLLRLFLEHYPVLRLSSGFPRITCLHGWRRFSTRTFRSPSSSSVTWDRLQTEEGSRSPRQSGDICTGRRLIQESKRWETEKGKRGERKIDERLKNKTVLLRERKRHTARCVASARHAVPVGEGGYLPWWLVPTLGGTYPGGVRGTYHGGGGYLPWWGRGIHTLVGGWGYLPWWGGWGVPTLVGWGYLPRLGGTCSPGGGYLPR